MLEINVKLVPFGIKDREREIARVTIWNKATGTRDFGNYGYKVVDSEDSEVSGDYDGFDRSKGALKLLHEILNEVF